MDYYDPRSYDTVPLVDSCDYRARASARLERAVGKDIYSKARESAEANRQSADYDKQKAAIDNLEKRIDKYCSDVDEIIAKDNERRLKAEQLIAEAERICKPVPTHEDKVLAELAKLNERMEKMEESVAQEKNVGDDEGDDYNCDFGNISEERLLACRDQLVAAFKDMKRNKGQ